MRFKTSLAIDLWIVAVMTVAAMLTVENATNTAGVILVVELMFIALCAVKYKLRFGDMI